MRGPRCAGGVSLKVSPNVRIASRPAKPDFIDSRIRETGGSLPGSEAFDQNSSESLHGSHTEVPVANDNRPGATGPDRSGTDELPLLFASVLIHL
jgi:hypothetical protein